MGAGAGGKEVCVEGDDTAAGECIGGDIATGGGGGGAETGRMLGTTGGTDVGMGAGGGGGEGPLMYSSSWVCIGEGGVAERPCGGGKTDSGGGGTGVVAGAVDDVDGTGDISFGEGGEACFDDRILGLNEPEVRIGGEFIGPWIGE